MPLASPVNALSSLQSARRCRRCNWNTVTKLALIANELRKMVALLQVLITQRSLKSRQGLAPTARTLLCLPPEGVVLINVLIVRRSAPSIMPLTVWRTPDA